MLRRSSKAGARQVLVVDAGRLRTRLLMRRRMKVVRRSVGLRLVGCVSVFPKFL